MAADGKVEVELRLLTDKFKKDLKEAMSSAQKEFDKAPSGGGGGKGGGSGGGSGSSKGSQEDNKPDTKSNYPLPSGGGQTPEQKAAWDAMVKRNNAIRAANNIPNPPRVKPNIPNPLAIPGLGGAASAVGGSGGALPPSVTGVAGGAGAAGGSAPAAGAGMALAAPLGLAALVVGTLVVELMLFKKAIKITFEQMEKSRALYAKSLTSGGLPLGFTAHRGKLAEIIGVGEEDVLQYGDAVKYLSSQIERSTGIIADATPELTSLSWEWRVLKTDMEALKASLGKMLAPAIRGVIYMLHQMVQGLLRVMEFINKVNQYALNLVRTVRGWFGGKKHEQGPAPAPAASAKRMEPSSWERMGFVLGIGGGNSPQVETAKNTKKMANLLEKLLAGNGHIMTPGQKGAWEGTKAGLGATLFNNPLGHALMNGL